ncbi:MAG: cupin domain-containing protein [Chloroflexi bacterium]|nr:cupin domain-containing protein [Chloroflexota bacterium]
MPKPELEFFDPESIPWVPTGDKPGAYEKILSSDPETGNYTRLFRVVGPSEGTKTLVHDDFWEEIFLIKGSITDLVKNETYHAGYYACRPPGMTHGPYRTEGESIGFEVRYYVKK